MSKKMSQQVVKKSPSMGAWVTRAAKSIAMIYTYGLVLSVSGAASYFSSQLVKGNFSFLLPPMIYFKAFY